MGSQGSNDASSFDKSKVILEVKPLRTLRPFFVMCTRCNNVSNFDHVDMSNPIDVKPLRMIKPIFVTNDDPPFAFYPVDFEEEHVTTAEEVDQVLHTSPPPPEKEEETQRSLEKDNNFKRC